MTMTGLAVIAYIDRLQRRHAYWTSVATQADQPAQPKTLDEQMRIVLLELMLVSSGTTTSYNATGGGEKINPMPPGEKIPPHDYWARQYDAQETDDGRRAIIKAARDDLNRLAGRYERDTTTVETPEEYRARFLRETERWSPEEIEHSAWRISPRITRSWRKQAQRHPETGKPTTLTVNLADPASETVRLRREEGLSTREIAKRLDIGQTQVMRYLRRAA